MQLTLEDIFAFLEREIAIQHLAGNREALRRSQLVAGYLMQAAQYVHDHETATRLRVLAARSANLQEELGGDT